MTSEKRDIADFDQVYLKVHHEAELTITQGEHNSLSIIAPGDMLQNIVETVKDGKLTLTSKGKWYEKARDAVRTSITRKVVKYNLKVKNLKQLEIDGIARVSASRIEADHLYLQLNGAGTINIEKIEVNSIEVLLPGAGKITLAGDATEQKVTIKGAGEYYAPKLETMKAELVMKGVGSATVWVKEEFDVTAHGIGNVSYYGEPKIKSDISAVASLNSLGVPDW